MYKAYVLNCQFVNATKLQHIQFLGNCVIELFRIDLSIAYQHAFIFIRQLAMILREALNTRTKVYLLTILILLFDIYVLQWKAGDIVLVVSTFRILIVGNALFSFNAKLTR